MYKVHKWIPYVDMDYSFVCICRYYEAMFTCSKCGHQWFQRSVTPPRRCPNHQCRSVYWNTTAPLAAPIEKAAPAVESKVEKLSDLQNIITSVMEKPKERRSDYYTKPHPALLDYRPQDFDEPTVSYE